MQQQEVHECCAIKNLKQLLHQTPDRVVIVDVRSPEEFSEKSIPGAINIPLPELENRIKELSKDDTIITVCGKGGGRSASGAALLKQSGFSNAAYLCGGTFGWYEENG